MIELKDITWDNFWNIINLKTTEAQRGFLPSNAVFMAQAYVNLKIQHPDACFAIYNGDEAIGFTKIVFVSKDVEPFHFSEDTYYLDAMMIDEKYQGKGYGKLALTQILAFMHTKPWGDACSIKTACYDANPLAAKLYENFGFVKTDRFVSNKEGLRLYVYTSQGY